MTNNPMTNAPMTTMKQYNAATADWAQMPLVLSVNEMARVLGIGRRKAYELINEPGFPRVKLGGIYKVNTGGLRRYLEEPADYEQGTNEKTYGGRSL